MNETSFLNEKWVNEIQYGSAGAALFIIAYIGFYGFIIISFFVQQLKQTQRQRNDLPAYVLKTLWDIPTKNKLYEELADVDRLKRIFRGYFMDHESHTSTTNQELQAIVEERAYACASKYREKLRRLHLSHVDYYLDTLPTLSRVSNDDQEQVLKSMALTHTSSTKTSIDSSKTDDYYDHFQSVSVV